MFTTVKEISDAVTDAWVELYQIGMTNEVSIKCATALSIVAIPVLPITGITYTILYSKTLSKLKKLED